MIVYLYTSEESSVQRQINYIPLPGMCITLNGRLYTVEDVVYDVDNNIVRIYAR